MTSKKRVWLLAGITGVAVLAAAGTATAVVRGGSRPADDPGRVSVHHVKESPRQVHKYWTPERQREAKPMPLLPGDH